jgi:chromosome segregation ATPase
MRDDPTIAVLTALAALKEGQQHFVEALERLRSELIGRMDRVDSAITAIRDDITVTMRLADRAQEAADQTRGELSVLGDRVTAMMHQIQDLQAEVRHLKGEGPRTE